MAVTVNFDPINMYSRKPQKKRDIESAVQNASNIPAGAVTATVVYFLLLLLLLEPCNYS
jgi:hypothetical protein